MRRLHRQGALLLAVFGLTSVFLLILFSIGILHIPVPRTSDPRPTWEISIDADGFRRGSDDSSVPAAAGAGLTGVVVNESGGAILGATVVMAGVEDRSEFRQALAKKGHIASTDDAGRFSLDKPTESVWLVVRHPDYLTSRVRPHPDRPDTPLRIVMHRGLSLRGRVIAATGNLGIEGVRVVARGIGAEPEAGRPDRVPGVRARLRSNVSGPHGEFEFHGMEPGIYQIEAVAASLTTLPANVEPLDAAWSFNVGERTVTARAGQSETVSIRVLPVAAAVVRIESATGGLVPNPAFSRKLGPGLLPWTRCLGADRDVVMADGRVFDGRASELPGGTHAFLFVAQRWPVAESSMTLTVHADGFSSVAVDVPVGPLATLDSPTVIRLQPTGSRGEVVFATADAQGRSIGPLASSLLLQPTSDGMATLANLRILRSGVSDPLSLPAGSYDVATFEGMTPMWSGQPVVVRAGRSTQARLTLIGSVLKLSVVDEANRPIAGLGLKLARGHEAVRVDHRVEDGVLTVTGMFEQSPGLGGLSKAGMLLEPGPWTVEVYCVGYEPSRAFVECRAGEITETTLVMRERPDGEWDGWDKTPRTGLHEAYDVAEGKAHPHRDR